MSVDGYIAGPSGEYDWIAGDPSFDMEEHYRGFDTLLMGRGTYELMLQLGQTPKAMGMEAVVVSTTLDAEKHPDVRIVRDGVAEAVAELKAGPGKDIWLFGGAVLFRSMLDAGLVDVVELAVQPILLGGGVRVIADGRMHRLRLENVESFPSGMMLVRYAVGAASA